MVHPSAFVSPQAKVHETASIGPWCLVDAGELVVITAGDVQTSPRMGDYTTSTNMCMVAQVQ